MEKQFKKRHSFRRVRRLFSMLCCICLMTMMLPGIVYADTGENVETYSEDSYAIWIGDVQVTSANAGNVLAGDAKNDGKVIYDPATKTLTLNGADITVTTEDPPPNTSDYESEALKIEEDELTLHLNGENKITLTADADLTHQTSVIKSTGNLTINGSGSLEIFNATSSDTDIHGLRCLNTVTVSDVNLIVRNDGTEGSMLGFNIAGRFIQNSGTVSSRLGTAGEINAMMLAGYAEINGGSLMAQAGAAKENSFGIYVGGAGGLTINGGTVLAEGNTTDEGSLSVGIYALDNMIINGGNLMVQSGGEGACYGIYSISSDFIQNGGTVSVKSGNAGKGSGSIGLLVTDATISSGTLEVFAQSGDDLSSGIIIYSYGEDGDGVFSDKTPDLSKYTYALVTAGSDKNSAVEVEVPDLTTYRQAYVRIEPYQCTEHNWADTWEHDADSHWHLCTNRGCTTKSQKVDHTFVEGSPDPAPTLQTEGQRIDTCSICGETRTVVLPNLTDTPPDDSTDSSDDSTDLFGNATNTSDHKTNSSSGTNSSNTHKGTGGNGNGKPASGTSGTASGTETVGTNSANGSTSPNTSNTSSAASGSNAQDTTNTANAPGTTNADNSTAASDTTVTTGSANASGALSTTVTDSSQTESKSGNSILWWLIILIILLAVCGISCKIYLSKKKNQNK